MGGQAGIRRNDCHGKFSVLLDGHDIHMKPFSNVQLPNGFPDPAVRDLHLEDRIVIAQRNVIKNMVRAVSNGSPESHLFLRIYHLIRTVAQQEFGLYIPGGPCHHFFGAQLL